MDLYCTVIVRESAKITLLRQNMVVQVFPQEGSKTTKELVKEYFQWLFHGKPFRVLKTKSTAP